MPRVSLRILIAMTAVTFLPAEQGSSRDRIDPVNSAGFELDLASLPSPHPRPVPAERPSDTAPLWLRLAVPWSLVEKVPAQYDWSVVDAIVESHAAAGFSIVMSLQAGNPLHDGSAGEEEAWTAFLREAAGRYGGQIDHYVLGEGRPLQELPPEQASYWLKVSSVAIQAADAGSRIAAGGFDASRPDAARSLAALYEGGVAVYLDAISVRADSGDQVAALRQTMVLQDPSARIWWSGREVSGGAAGAGRLLRGFLEGLQQEAALTTVRLETGDDGMPVLLGVLDRIRREVMPEHAPLVESGRGLQILTAMGETVQARVVRLYDPDRKNVLIAYDAGEGAPRGAQAVMVVDSLDVAEPFLKDVAAGEQAAAGAWQKDDAAGVTRVAVPLADYPLLLQYRRFTTPLFGEEERLQVTERRLPSVDEIIARHQAFQAAQSALLLNWRGDARIDFHFRIGAGSTVDVTILNTVFYDPKVGAEYEQKEYYVNGVKWRTNRLPEFPLPQPEKVLTLPLEISLDRRYEYRLEGEETIDGYECWVVDFEPLVPEGSLYKGRVWIDKATFARVQLSTLQTGLEPPIITNDQKDSYRPIEGPAGVRYWLPSGIEGQQVYSTSGRNLVVYRQVSFAKHIINDRQFEGLRRTAYESDRAIVRETDEGPRHLERTPDGGRKVQPPDTDNLFALAGVINNRSLDFPIPLAGVNYFHRDLFGRGIQANIFYGGVLAFGNLSDPALFGTRLEGSLDLFLQGFSGTDRPVEAGEEIDEESVDITRQNIEAGVALPFADHWRVKWTAGLRFEGYAQDEETASDFIIPTDTGVTTLGMEGEFNRKTWRVGARVDVLDRGTWEPWGFDGNPDFSQDNEDFVRYEGAITKEFFLPGNHKLHGEVIASGGADLDRFSKYRFDFFENRLRGFSGAGVRYTNGAKARLQYAFNLGSLVRFEATVDHARVKDRDAAAAGGDEFQDFTGFGISGQTIVGPNLILTLDWGMAIASDVEEFEGDQEIFLTVLHIFH